MRVIVLFVATFSAVCAAARQVPSFPKLMPMDEARQEQALADVRDRLLLAARAKDVGTVMQFVSPNLRLGDTGNVDKQSWQKLQEVLLDPENESWTGLENALSLGGSFTTTRGAVSGRREFCAPYVYSAFPQGIAAERTPWVVIDKDVSVHRNPSSKSPVLGTLSYAIVPAIGAAQHDPANYDVVWQSIDIKPDEEAFVLAAQIRNPEAYHVCFANEAGRWVVSAFTPRWGL